MSTIFCSSFTLEASFPLCICQFYDLVESLVMSMCCIVVIKGSVPVPQAPSISSMCMAHTPTPPKPFLMAHKHCNRVNQNGCEIISAVSVKFSQNQQYKLFTSLTIRLMSMFSKHQQYELCSCLAIRLISTFSKHQQYGLCTILV